MKQALIPLACIALALVVGGCARFYVASADKEVASILDEYRPEVEGPRPGVYRNAREKLGFSSSAVSASQDPAAAADEEETDSSSESHTGEGDPAGDTGEVRNPSAARDSSAVAGKAPKTTTDAHETSSGYGNLETVTDGYAGMPVPDEIRNYVATIDRQEEVLPPLDELLPKQGRALALPDALALAVEQGRPFQTEVENRYLTALELTLKRHDFRPILSATMATVFKTGDTTDTAQTSTFSTGISDVLPTGGTVTIQGSLSLSRNYYTPANSDDASYGISLAQPLLRGAGYVVSHESLTQQERNVLYEIRSFELFRQDYAVEIAGAFWGVLLSEQLVRNTYDSYLGAVEARRKAVAQERSGQAKPLDVMRARLDELGNKNKYVDEVESYENSLDAFKIRMALPTEEALNLTADVGFDYAPVSVDGDAAIEIALANRLDLMNAKGRVTDAERKVKVAENGLLPDLDLGASWGTSARGTGSLGGQKFSDGDVELKMSLGLPLDRTSERNSYRSALLTLAQRRRSYSQAVDEVKRDVRDVLRRLRTAEATLKIQFANTHVSKRRLEYSEVLFDLGKANNRDIVEARKELLGAQNSYARAVKDYRVARLIFMRQLGILLIDEKGMWIL